MSLIHTLKSPPGSGVVAASTLIPTGPKTSAYTAVAGDFVVVDTTSGAVTIGLPSGASDGAQVGVKHATQGGINAVTVACNGSDVVNRSGGPTTFTLPTLGQTATLQYKSGIWYVISGDLSLSQLDARLRIEDPISVGQELFSRQYLTGTTVGGATGVVRFTYFTSRKSEVSTQVRTASGGTAAAATPTLSRVGLYLIDGSDNGTLVASIANDTTLWTTASTSYTRSWTSSYSLVDGQRYAVAMLCVTTATAPSWAACFQFQPPAQAEINAVPRLTGALASQTDLPSSFTASSLVASAYRHYAAILP